MSKDHLPEGFKYTEAYMKGRPEHVNDAFAARHPRMSRAKRAKLFAPFDALEGYGSSIDMKDIEYVSKKVLTESEKIVLDRQLRSLEKQFADRRSTQDSQLIISVDHYVPCTDRNRIDWQSIGTYEVLRGVLERITAVPVRSLTVSGVVISVDDIVKIEFESDFL